MTMENKKKFTPDQMEGSTNQLSGISCRGTGNIKAGVRDQWLVNNNGNVKF